MILTSHNPQESGVANQPYDKSVAHRGHTCPGQAEADKEPHRQKILGCICLSILALLLQLFLTRFAHARPPGESEFLAANLTAEEIAIWIEKIESRPRSVGIFSVRVSTPLESDYGSIIETEVLKQLRSRNLMTVIGCPECKVPRVKVSGDRIVITKGAPELDAFKELGRKLSVESFLVIDVYRTSLSVITNATLYQTSSGEVISAERFKVPALDFSNSAMQFMMLAGPGFTLGGKSLSPNDSSFPLLANILILEELGFGKGGLNLGGIFAGDQGSLFYVQPTIGWRGRFGATAISSLFRVGAGFGLQGKDRGASAQITYDIFIGSFTVVGLDAVGFVPVRSPNSQSFNGYLGLHMGLSLGR
ncbi:MAG: hypothetical protein AB7F43_10170 [Bacteriovoracia bacterium]